MTHIELQAISADVAVLAAVLDASSDAIVLQDTSGRIVRWNARALDLFGLTDEEIEGRNWIDPRWRFIGPDGSDLPGDLHPSSLVLHSGEAIDGFEMGVHRPNGERRWLSVNSRPLRDGDGELLGVLTDFRDLTDEVDKASSSNADAERFRTAFDRSPVALLIVDDKGRFLDANPALCELFGIPLDVITGLDWITLSERGVSVQLSRLLLPPFVTETEPDVIEYHQPGGRIRHGLTQVCEIRWPGAEHAAMVQIVDVTDRFEATREAELLADQFRVAFENSPVGTGLISSDGVWLRANPAIARLLGQPLSRLVGASVRDSVHPDDVDLVERFVARALQGRPATVDHRMCKRSGEVRWLRTQITRVETVDSPALLIQSVDHTAERRSDVVLRSIDQTTGLLSRDGIVGVLEDRILAGRHFEESFAVFCVDIDDFRGINDRTGAAAADRLLEHVGVSMQAAMPIDSEVGRMHGDVFVGIANQSNVRDTRRTAEGILLALSHLNPAGETERIKTRVGAALIEASDVAPEDLIARVEQLAQDARRQTNRFLVESASEAAYRADPHAIGMSWYEEIEEALNDERFLVVGEPLAGLKGLDSVRRQELLIRLVLPRGVRVSMPRFERHAQRLGLAASVDAWVIRKGAQVLMADPNTEIEVNLGLAAVTDPSTIELLLELADADRGLAPRMLLALNEHMVSESLREVLTFSEELTAAGYGFCVDDHGWSAKGLQLLESIGARRVKLSPDSMRQVGHGDKADTWLRSTIRAMQEMGVEVAVPFVTDAEVYERVSTLGADFAQGVYIGSSVVID